MDIRELCLIKAQERGIRESTMFSYRTLLLSMGIEDDSLTFDEIEERLMTLDNINTRRASAVAVRSVLGHKVRIPKGQPKRYNLPSEDSLRMALVLTKYEIRGLLMMYAGCRVGEACAITPKCVVGEDRLRIDRQVVELYASAYKTGGEAKKVLRVGPVKTSEREIVIPHWLVPRIHELGDFDTPVRVRTAMYHAGKKMGFPLNPHQLRHWYCTTSLARGIPMMLVSKQMGHSDIATTLRTYSQHSDEDIHKAFG